MKRYLYHDITDSDYCVKGKHSFEKWDKITDFQSSTEEDENLLCERSIPRGELFYTLEEATKDFGRNKGMVVYFPQLDITTVLYALKNHTLITAQYNQIWNNLNV